MLDGGIDTLLSATNPCYEFIQGNQYSNVYRGQNVNLSVVRPATSNVSPMDRKVWIDFNMDGLFTNDELVMNEMNAMNLSRMDTVLVSNTQRLGSTRMRVGVTYAGTQLNPSVLFLGVFRDYIVNFPMDTIKPTMSLVGGSTVFTEINKPYLDSGVMAMDNIEGNIFNVKLSNKTHPCQLLGFILRMQTNNLKKQTQTLILIPLSIENYSQQFDEKNNAFRIDL
jgi:hypothetical protein